MKRHYPMACRSLLCGETSCPNTCPHLPELEDFRAWQHRTHARQPDPIWCPGVWESTNHTD